MFAGTDVARRVRLRVSTERRKEVKVGIVVARQLMNQPGCIAAAIEGRSTFLVAVLTCAVVFPTGGKCAKRL